MNPENGGKEKNYEIPESLLLATIEYISTQPLANVVGIWSRLRSLQEARRPEPTAEKTKKDRLPT